MKSKAVFFAKNRLSANRTIIKRGKKDKDRAESDLKDCQVRRFDAGTKYRKKILHHLNESLKNRLVSVKEPIASLSKTKTGQLKDLQCD